VALALAVLRQPDCSGLARSIASDVLGKGVPDWHWVIVRDEARNAAYEAALRRAIRPDSHVLDIGAGTGLLGLMAARTGAGRVTGCDLNPAVAAVAAEIARENGFGDRLRILSANSRDLRIGEHLERPVDVIVSEIVDNGLLGEGVLPTHRDAVARLLRPGGTVIPAVGSIMAALGFDAALDGRGMATHSGFDLSRFNALAPLTYSVEVGWDGLHLMSDSAALFRVPFGRPDQWPQPKAAVTVTARAGTANVIAQWIRLDLDDSGAPGSVIENRPQPGTRSCWGVLLRPLPAPVALAEGETVRIAGRHTDTSAVIWLDR
jgi:type II protein arginine methyltransferase